VIHFFRDRTSTNDLTPFENERAQASPREIGGSRQAIVTRADNDHVVIQYLSVVVGVRS